MRFDSMVFRFYLNIMTSSHLLYGWAGVPISKCNEEKCFRMTWNFLRMSRCSSRWISTSRIASKSNQYDVEVILQLFEMFSSSPKTWGNHLIDLVQVTKRFWLLHHVLELKQNMRNLITSISGTKSLPTTTATKKSLFPSSNRIWGT